MSAQVVLGAIAGLILSETGTVIGVAGAILAGITAPAILSQLGRLEPVQNLVAGGHEAKQRQPVDDTISKDIGGQTERSLTDAGLASDSEEEAPRAS